MVKRMKPYAVFILTIVIMISVGLSVRAQETENGDTDNKYNIVFVMDESGSMKQTDPTLLRYDAVELFLSLMANEGNYVGAVTFNGQIIYTQDICSVNGKNDKESVFGALKDNQVSSGYTDIGEALVTAVGLLEENANPELSSIIILLTDGNTDLDNNMSVESEKETASLEKKAEAIESARNAGYRIYSVCLNVNGTADPTETAQISSGTGGESMEVTDVSDLSDVLTMFYEIIYGTSRTSEEGTMPYETIFKVPTVGVEEVNITMDGSITEVVLAAPDGTVYEDAEVTQAGDVFVEKIVEPQAGEWSLYVNGDDGATVAIDFIYNYNYKVADCSSFEESYQPGDIVTIRAMLTTSDGKDLYLEDDGFYAAEMRLVNEADEVIETIPMTVVDGGFECTYTIGENDHAYRYYEAVMLSDSSGDNSIVKKSQFNQFISGSNTAPVSNGDVEKTIYLWPFKQNIFTLDLASLALDEEDETLTYLVVSSSFIDKEDDEDGDYSIDGTTLTQDRFSLRQGSYLIRCVDSGGLYCTVKVSVKTVNIGMITAIFLVLAGLVVLAVFIYGIYQASHSRFNGDIYLRLGYDGEEVMRTKARGKIRLNTFNIPLPGIDANKSYFQAMGGSKVGLVTNKEIYYRGRAAKKIEISSSSGGMGTEIMLDKEGTNVLYVRFVSRGRASGRKPASKRRGSTRGTSGAGRGASSGGRTTRGTSSRSTSTRGTRS